MNWDGANLRSLRLRLGWCTANFARQLGCPQILVMKWESGEEFPDSSFNSRLRSLFDFAELNAERMKQRILAENLLREMQLDQVTGEEFFRLTDQL